MQKGDDSVTQILQRWRKPSNPIRNAIGFISDKIDFLISAPYADKLPLKVAELIRKNVPFAVLLPLSLLNDIERTGKTGIDESVRQKRLDMKLVIATSLGQGWLISHPECKVSNSAQSVFFTTCPSNEQLHNKGTEAFHKWTESTNGAKISPKSLNRESDIDTLCLKSVERLMKMVLLERSRHLVTFALRSKRKQIMSSKRRNSPVQYRTRSKWAPWWAPWW